MTKTEIVNLALLLIGAEKIGSMSDSSKSAILANTIYDQCEREISQLPNIEWKFLTARAQLARHASGPAFGSFDYQYTFPQDCQKILKMCDMDGDEIEYPFSKEVLIETDPADPTRTIQTDVILTNEEEVYVKYLIRRSDPTCWPAWFARLVAVNIAVYLTQPIKKDTGMWQKLNFMWREAWNLAKAQNALENVVTDGAGRNLDLGNNDVLNAPFDGLTDYEGRVLAE